MPLFIVIASVFALICTAGLALPLVILVIVALACRRPHNRRTLWRSRPCQVEGARPWR